jgi:hypothetical protein
MRPADSGMLYSFFIYLKCEGISVKDNGFFIFCFGYFEGDVRASSKAYFDQDEIKNT